MLLLFTTIAWFFQLFHPYNNTPYDVRVQLYNIHFNLFISVFNQLDAQNLFHSKFYFMPSTCFEHMCSSSGGQNCFTQPLGSSHPEAV